jgi:hypothetical protein
MIADLWENRLHYFATLEAIFDGDDEEHEKYDLMMHKFVMDLDGECKCVLACFYR